MSSFFIALNAVIPFALYISFGYVVKRAGVVEEGMFTKLNTLVFKCFFPIVMFDNLYHTEIGEAFDKKMLIAGIVSVLALEAVLLIVVPRFVEEDRRRGVIIQAVFRSNTVLFALPLAVSVCGEASASAAAVIIAVIIPIYNITAVIILERFRGGKADVKNLLRSVITNPLIEGAVIGFLFLILKIRIPDVVMQPVKAFSSMTSPLALFALGGTLHARGFRDNRRYLIPVTAVKMILLPAVAMLVIFLLRMRGASGFLYLILFASPVAVSSYTMAENMGGDGELAGQIVVLSTFISVFTLFGWIYLYSRLGLL